MDAVTEPKHRAHSAREWPYSDPITQAEHTDEWPCPACRPERYTGKHRAEVD
jgi:hypothetical protein